MVNQVALVSETRKISSSPLSMVSAAIQKQVSRDLGPIWDIEATVDAFDNLEDVPLGYWQVIIKESIGFDAGGIHLNTDNGQPFALVEYSEDWSLTTSHETLEMLVSWGVPFPDGVPHFSRLFAKSGAFHSPETSSVTTVNPVRFAIPNEVVMATSEASRPVAISTRPIRGCVWRASKVHQRFCR
jgi:hypothetical protein